uniref:Reverse transcriptase Ty1/copia-type domain-containing protein n=1 Tax=Fagus sylvatica TaxID=28930 RepID=A0A2N9F4X6_FAGSY
MEPTTNSAQNTSNPTPVHSPLLLLNNMANLMSTKLDSTNYMIWKLQITVVLDAYSMLDHLDGFIPKPKLSQEVWNTLEERFTSTTRSNVLNLKLELQSINKAEEQSMQEASDPQINSALAMFVSHNRPSSHYNGSQGYTRGGRGRNSFSRGRGGGRSSPNYTPPNFNSPSCLTTSTAVFICSTKIPDYISSLIDLHAKSVGSKTAETWLTDSGASDHITASSTNLNPQAPYQGQESSLSSFYIYLDDIVLTSNTPSYLDQLIAQLFTVFDLKDLGPLHYFLGLQVTRSSSGLYLNQAKYATDLLKKHNMLDSKPAKSPSCPNTRLSLHEGDALPDPHGYRSLVGALHYLTFTRPDISFSVHQVCQYMSAPTTIHLAAAKRILRYIRGTLFHGVAFTPGPLHLSAFTDADWAGDPDDRRSTSGYLVYLGSNPITWSAKKQPTVSRSSTESEYRALAIASAELCWIRTLLKDLGVFLSQTPVLWCDNVSALAIARIRFFMLAQSTLKLIFTSLEREFFVKTLLSNLFPLLINWLIFLQKACPHNASLICNAISRSPSL